MVEDVVVFSLQYPQRKELTFSSSSDIYMATANKLDGDFDNTSFVNIYKYNYTTKLFDYKHAIIEIAACKLEFFALKDVSGKARYFLAVGGNLYGIRMKAKKCSLNVYEIKQEQTLKFSKMSKSIESLSDLRAVTALKYITTGKDHYLAAGILMGSQPIHLYLLGFKENFQQLCVVSKMPLTSITDLEAIYVEKETLLAVSISHNALNSYRTESVIYKFNNSSNSFIECMRFDTANAEDLEAFQINNIWYLAVANNYEDFNSHIYQLSPLPKTTEKVVQTPKPKHTIPIYHDRQLRVIHVPGCKSKALLFYTKTINGDDVPGLYTISKNMEIQQSGLVLLDQASPRSNYPAVLLPFQIGEKLFLVTGSRDLALLQVEYELETVKSPWFELQDKTMKELNILQQNIDEINQLIKSLEDIFKSAVNKDVAQFITANKKFKHVKANRMLVSNIDVSNGSLYYKYNGTKSKAGSINHEPANVSSLEVDGFRHHTLIKQINDTLKNVYYTDLEQNVSNKALFDEVEVRKDTIVENIDILSGFINGLNIKELESDVVKQNSSEMISGTKILKNEILLKNDLVLGRKINGIDISENAVLIRKDQIINASKVIRHGAKFLSSLNVTNNFNSIDLSQEALHVRKSAIISGKKMLTENVETAQCYVHSLVDDVNVTLLIHDTLTANKSQIVNGRKTLSRILSLGNINITNLTNHVDLSELINRLAKFDSPMAHIVGEKKFFNVNIMGNVTIRKMLNNLAIPVQIVLIHGTQNITGKNIFTPSVTIAGNVTLEGMLDGIKASDVVTLSGQQTITGLKEFHKSITMFENIEVSHETTVDYVDISELESNVLHISNEQNINGRYIYFKTVTFSDEPNITGSIDNEPILDYFNLMDDAVLLKGSQVIKGLKRFDRSILVLQNLTVSEQLNGYFFPRKFLSVHKNEAVNSLKTFRNHTVFLRSLSVNGSVGSVFVEDLLNKLIVADDNGTIAGRKIFTESMKIHDNIACFPGATVNQMDISEEIMTTNTEQTITAYIKRFQNVTKSIEVTVHGNVSVNTTVDGIDLSEFRKQICIKSANQFSNECHIHTINLVVNNVTVKNLNGIDIGEFYEDAVTLTSDQIINSSKVFNGSFLSLMDIVTTSKIDDLEVSVLKEEALTIDSSANIDGKIAFHNLELNKDLKIAGTMHGVNITNLRDAIILKSKEITVRGTKEFALSVIVSGNIEAHKINEIDIMKDFVTKSRNQNIYGSITFTNTMKASNVTCQALVDEVNLTDLERQVVRRDIAQVIQGHKNISGKLHLFDNVSVSKEVDGVDLSEFNEKTIKTNRYALNCHI